MAGAYVVSLDEITSKHLSSTDTTVVGTLRSGETALGPSERLTISVEEGVLLLKTEPGLLLSHKPSISVEYRYH